MFIHNLKYCLKILFRKRALIFWTFMFPIALATFFNMAFSNIIDEEKLEVFDIAVVNDSNFSNNEVFKNALKELSDKDNKDRLYNIKYVSLDKASKLLEEERIEGYITFDSDTPKVVISKNGINQTILKYSVEEILSMESTISNLSENEIKKEIKKGNYSIDKQVIYDRVIDYTKSKSIKLNNKSNSNLSYVVIEFYTLIAMTCLYGGIISMTVINEILPNMCAIGKRRSISKVKKSTLIFSGLLSSFIVQTIGNILLFLFSLFVLKVDFGNNLWLVILLTLVGSLAGLSIGVFVSVIFKTNENLKIGIIIGFSMLCSYLAGMMGIVTKYMIDKNIPIVNMLNPANMVTDGLYSLYYYTTYNRYIFNVLSLLVFSLILILISSISLRRQQYDSI